MHRAAGLGRRSRRWRDYHTVSHTSGPQLGAFARRARPKLLVLYHPLLWGVSPEQLLAEIRAGGYQGTLVTGNDLDLF